MWAVDGTWERVFTALVAQADADEDLHWAVSVDSMIVQHEPRRANRQTTIGRFSGGLITKIPRSRQPLPAPRVRCHRRTGRRRGGQRLRCRRTRAGASVTPGPVVRVTGDARRKQCPTAERGREALTSRLAMYLSK